MKQPDFAAIEVKLRAAGYFDYPQDDEELAEFYARRYAAWMTLSREERRALQRGFRRANGQRVRIKPPIRIRWEPRDT